MVLTLVILIFSEVTPKTVAALYPEKVSFPASFFLLPQTDFFDFEGVYKPDFIGKFENFQSDIKIVIEHLGINKEFNVFQNKSKRKSDYSTFYTTTRKRMVEKKFQIDIKLLQYEFEDNRSGLNRLKKFL